MKKLTIKNGCVFLDGEELKGINRYSINGDVHREDKVELVVSMTVEFCGYEDNQQSEADASEEKAAASGINAKVVNMIILGYPCLRISEETGCSYGYIRSIAKMHGLKLNDPEKCDPEEDDGK